MFVYEMRYTTHLLKIHEIYIFYIKCAARRILQTNTFLAKYREQIS
jgi:hypothetical protein